MVREKYVPKAMHCSNALSPKNTTYTNPADSVQIDSRICKQTFFLQYLQTFKSSSRD